MGGSDQWGNIVTGTELIRRKAGGEAFAFTCPLIKKADGGKFGKTEKGNIWLDATKTSPYHFYQFWLNATDGDAEGWIKIFTFLTEPVINELLEVHRQDPSGRLLQKKLAEAVTSFVHGADELAKAIETTQKLFANQHAPADTMSETDLESIEGVVKIDIGAAELNNGVDIISFLANSGIFPSKGEAKKMLQNGGVSINRIKVEDLQLKMETSMLLHGKYLLVQKGKKNYFLVKVS